LKIVDNYKHFPICIIIDLLEFILNLSGSCEKLIEIASNYENLPQYLPDQLKSIKIIKVNNNETIAEEELVFSSIIKNKITQQTKHHKI